MTKPLTKSQLIDEAQKDKEIYGAFEISKDTIILLRRSQGIELSADHGKTWQWLAKDIPRIDEITMDDKGLLWGLERWKGIHEASYCLIHQSADQGKTWINYTFNTNVFFPYHICSEPNKPLQVVNFWSKKVYRLSGHDPAHHWMYVKQLPDRNDFADLSAGNYFVSRNNDNNKLYKKNSTGKADTLFVFTKAYNIYKIVKTGNTIYVAGPTDGGNSYFAVIKKDCYLQEFIIPGEDINLIKTQYSDIILTSTKGAFLFKNNSILDIFK